MRLAGVDPLRHYIRYGWREGRRPSRSFDPEWYLFKYGDIREAGVDPLLHFARFGMREGRSPLPPRGAPLDPARALGLKVRPAKPIVYLSCYLRKPERIHEAIHSLSRDLARSGVLLAVVTDAKLFKEFGDVEVVWSKPQLSDYDQIAGNAGPAWLEELAMVEARWLAGPSNETTPNQRRSARAAALGAYEFWRAELISNRPALMLVWGSTAPLSRLHLKLCSDLGIPTLIIERGHFPDTLSLDLVAQFGHGRLNALPLSLASSEKESVDAGRYLAWIRRSDDAPYGDFNRTEEWASVKERLRGRKYILLVGSNDLGSGSAFLPTESPERHSMLFGSSSEAAEYLSKVVEAVAPDMCFVFKPHPSSVLQGLVPDDTERCIVARHLNINQLIARSSATVTLSSTATVRALAEEIPLVLMGLSEVGFKGIAYEAHRLEDIPTALRRALRREGFEEKRRRGHAFLAYLFEHYLIGASPDVPTRLTLQDMTDTILNRATRYLPVESRRVDFQLKKTTRSRPATTLAVPAVRPIDIVVPVYADAKTTSECLESIFNADIPADSRVVVINDASPESELTEAVKRFAGTEPRMVSLTNDVNLGFPATVNRGIAHADRRDVIVLNSDTLVPEGFVQRLRETAYSSRDVSTVTPMSNNASIFSTLDFPRGGKLSGGLEEVRAIDAKLARVGASAVEVPVGHGFCLYMRRDCINLVSSFDELAFGRGYSEEVDYCQRARAHGFRHLCATNVFVGHIGGVSFAEEATPLKKRAREVIRERYPHHLSDVQQFIKADPLRSLRELVATLHSGRSSSKLGRDRND